MVCYDLNHINTVLRLFIKVSDRPVMESKGETVIWKV